MASPAPLKCGKTDCGYTTPPGIPTYDLTIKVLEIHARTAHPQCFGQMAAGIGQAGEGQQENPSIGIGIKIAMADSVIISEQQKKRLTGQRQDANKEQAEPDSTANSDPDETMDWEESPTPVN